MGRRFALVALGLVTLVALGLAAYRFLAIVPALAGDLADTRANLEAAGFRVEARYETDTALAPFESEAVVAQDPAAGRVALVGSTVRLIVEPDEGLVVMPDLLGRFESDALASLATAGLRSEAASGSATSSVVYSQEPSAGVSIPMGTIVEYQAAFPHRPEGDVPGVKRVHGLFYARYGLGGSAPCNQCHVAGTCAVSGCHAQGAYVHLSAVDSGPN